MISESHKNNLPDPIVRVYAGGIEMVFSKTTEISVNAPVNIPVNVPVNVLVNIPVEFNDRIKLIIKLISETPNISQNEIAKLCDVNLKTIKRDMKELREIGYITRIGADKNGYWHVLNNTDLQR